MTKAGRHPIATVAQTPVYWVRCRRKSIGLLYRAPGWLEVRSPTFCTHAQVLRFVYTKEDWIHRVLAREHQAIWVARDRLDADALRVFRAQVEDLARVYALALGGVPPTYRIELRSQRTRWGSCSAKGTLSINCACARLPTALLAYVVAHEICHLRHMDHSPAFYQTLAAVMPDAAVRQKELSRHRIRRDLLPQHSL